jgi:hypothetical protein
MSTTSCYVPSMCAYVYVKYLVLHNNNHITRSIDRLDSTLSIFKERDRQTLANSPFSAPARSGGSKKWIDRGLSISHVCTCQGIYRRSNVDSTIGVSERILAS